MEQKTPHKNYFEGILQLREPTQATIDFVYSLVDRQKKDWVRISQVKKVKGGVDFYCTSKKYLRIIGKRLLAHFGGELKESAQLYSRNHQTGKNIYRLNVMVRPSQFQTGDYIEKDNEIYRITSLGKRISATNLKTGSKILVKYEEELNVLKKLKTITTKVKPHLEVMDPETYQSTPTQNKKDVKMGEKVKIIKFNGSIYFAEPSYIKNLEKKKKTKPVKEDSTINPELVQTEDNTIEIKESVDITKE